MGHRDLTMRQRRDYSASSEALLFEQRQRKDYRASSEALFEQRQRQDYRASSEALLFEQRQRQDYRASSEALFEQRQRQDYRASSEALLFEQRQRGRTTSGDLFHGKCFVPIHADEVADVACLTAMLLLPSRWLCDDLRAVQTCCWLYRERRSGCVLPRLSRMDVSGLLSRVKDAYSGMTASLLSRSHRKLTV